MYALMRAIPRRTSIAFIFAMSVSVQYLLTVVI